MTPDTNKERAEFEAWYASQPDAPNEPERSYELDEAGMNELIKDCIWEGWKARAAKAPAAEPTGWYALAADGMATLCVDRDDAAKEAANSEKKWPHLGPYRAVQLYTAPPAPTEQWIGVTERLPEWVHRDDTPCHINGKEVPPTLTSKTVLVALDGGGVRTDKLTTIEGKSNGWWHTFGERVIAWQDAPAPPQGAAKGE